MASIGMGERWESAIRAWPLERDDRRGDARNSRPIAAQIAAAQRPQLNSITSPPPVTKAARTRSPGCRAATASR